MIECHCCCRKLAQREAGTIYPKRDEEKHGGLNILEVITALLLPHAPRMQRLNLSLLRLAEALINKAVYKVPRNQSPPLYRLVSRVFKTRGSNAQNLQSCDFAVWWSDCVAVLEPLIDSYKFRRAQREDEGLKVSVRHNPWWQTFLHQCCVCSNQSSVISRYAKVVCQQQAV